MLTREEKTGDVKRKVETGVMQPQAKESWQQKLEKSRMDSPLDPPGQWGPVNASFLSPDLQNCERIVSVVLFFLKIFFFFFDVDHFLKVFIEFLTILLLLQVLVF